jgi:hypothetical protein
MKPNATTSPRDKRAALKAVEHLNRQLGDPLFGWAVRKRLAIKAKERSIRRVQRAYRAELKRLRAIAR